MSSTPDAPHWRTSRPLRVLMGVVLFGVALIAKDVLTGLPRTDDPTGDLVVLGCVAVMGTMAAWPTLRPYARIDDGNLTVRNALNSWELPLARITEAHTSDTLHACVTDDEGKTRIVAVASHNRLDRMFGLDQRGELLDALAARGVPVEHNHS